MNPYEKCLTIAEGILSALEDQSIFERYKGIKSQIEKSETNKSVGIIIKNTPLVDWIVAQLNKIQTEILPESASLQSDSLEDAITSLDAVIETKVTSYNYLKQKIMAQNATIREKISRNKEFSINEIQDIRKKRILMEEMLEQKVKNLIEHEKGLQKEKSDTISLVQTISKENEYLQKSIEEAEIRVKNAKQKKASLEKTIESLADDMASLEKNLEKSLYDLQINRRAYENLESIDKFRSSGFSLADEKQRIYEEITSLKAKNAKLQKTCLGFDK